MIGDKRNDENTIVAQLHTVFQRFHNRYASDNPDMTFEEVQREVRWHYQWVVLHDYLIKICGKEMVDSILPHLASGGSIFVEKPALRHYSFDNDPFIPTEFSAAAFRFGHSMVRPVYRLSRGFQDIPDPNKPKDILDQNSPQNSRRMIFDLNGQQLGLNGFGAIPTGWAIEWDLFFGNLDENPLLPGRVQPAYKVDTSLVNPLAELPEFFGEEPNSNLAYRNLLRGFAMKLPSGQDVARAMGEPVLLEKWLVIGKAEIPAVQPPAVQPPAVQAPAVQAPADKGPRAIASFELEPNVFPFADATPLWLYILSEGAKNVFEGKPYALGPVGGRIVAETMIGILLGDKRSYLIQDPNWTPMGGAGFDMLAFINYATNKPTANTAAAASTGGQMQV